MMENIEVGVAGIKADVAEYNKIAMDMTLPDCNMAGRRGLGSPRGGAGSPRGGAGSPRGGAGSPRGGAGSPRGGAGSPRGSAGSPRLDGARV